MSLSKKQSYPKYFWLLDNELPSELLNQYRDALDGHSASGLSATVRLLEARVPIPPKAYLTSSLIKTVCKKPTPEFIEELGSVLERFEKQTHSKFGGREKPLLVSVQGDFCGSIRNIGVHLNGLRALIHQYGAGNAYKLYIDFLESYSTLVLGCPSTDFRKTFDISSVRQGGAANLADLSEERFTQHVREYQNLVSQKIGRAFPDAPERHLLSTIVYCSKAAEAAGGDEIYLGAHVHKSQYGQSVAGVVYTRNPFNGKKDLYGVYQFGEKDEKGSLETGGERPDHGTVKNGDAKSLRERLPQAYALLQRYMPEVEACFRDVMEAEFATDEDGHLYFTGFDKANTTARATLVSAVDLNLSGKISDLEAAHRIKPNDVEVLLHPTLDDQSRTTLEDLGSTGVTAAPGTSVGHVFFKMSDAMDFYRAATKQKKDARVILIANELLISDTPGLGIISGLVTKASGIASHAAVMARANGIPCIVGYKGLEIDPKAKGIAVNGRKIEAGTLLTLEAGAEGRLFLGQGTLQNLSFKEGVVRDVAQLMSRLLKQEKIPMEVRVNINNAKDAETGFNFGAAGVGLCRTENMFMEPEALREIRNIVFSPDTDLCKESFEFLETKQFEDFKKIFQVMRDRVVNIRLMDLPLHDFVPQTEEDFEKLCAQLKHMEKNEIRAAAEGLREHNPMLGLRACRFGLIRPEVYDMQIRAIVRAAYSVTQLGFTPSPGIMFPLVFTEQELTRLKARVMKIEEEIREKIKVPYGTRITFKVGSMIELPAAALSADKLAKVGEFFAFGTNDLTQTSLGMSRDDSSHYLPFYLEQGLLASDPFKVLQPVVKELVEMAVSRGRRVRKDASYGICGEQGGDRASLVFCLERALNYVSCSPFRVLPTIVALVHVATQTKSTVTPLKAATAVQTDEQDAEAVA